MMTRYVAWRIAVLAGAALLTLGLGRPAAANHNAQVAYFTNAGDGTNGGLLIDWQGARARVVNQIGARSGAVSGDASQLVVTLDSPLSQADLNFDVDSCGEFPQRRRDTMQIAVRDAPRGHRREDLSEDQREDHRDLDTSQVVELGTLTTLDGCDTGQVAPFGTLTDPGVTYNRLPMKARPSVRDLVPGTQVAGFSEQALMLDDELLAVDVVTLYAGGMALFATTGRVVPAQFNEDRWLVFNFGSFERAYTRLAVEEETGVEIWLRAEWSGGQALRVIDELIVKPAPGASFGNQRRASRKWESGLFTATRVPFSIHLYRGGSGERVLNDLDAGVETREPINWVTAGNNILQTRVVRPGVRRDRTWVPLRNRGSKIRFVLESEIQTFDDGTSFVFFPPRVNFYIDRGKAVPPPAPSAP